MLKSYEICNFKSFKNKTVIDLTKTSYDSLSDQNTSGDILKGVLFVGANASGKSNAVIAVKFLLDLLFKNEETGIQMYRCLFSPDPQIQMKYNFFVNGSEIVYTVSFFCKKPYSVKELLTVDGIDVLERDGNYAKVNITEPAEHHDVSEEILFLREVYFSTKFRGNQTLQRWFKELSSSVYLDLYKEEIDSYSSAKLDTDKYLEANGEDRINDFFEKYHFDQLITYSEHAMGSRVRFDSDKKSIFFKRYSISEPIPAGFESIGNQNLIRLLPVFFHCLDNNGILLLDEFSSGFHNDLEEMLVQYFMRKSKNAQLIFVSHSTNLLTNRLLRPDQIYAVDFDENGSRLNRFSNEDPRPAQNIEKMYLSGRFDGVPRYGHNS